MSNPYLGEVRLVGFNYAPAGWAFCNGAQIGISSNNALYNLIGTTYGGNGQSNFQIPNLTARMACGLPEMSLPTWYCWTYACLI